MKTEYKFMWAALLTATTASLCCITPILALITGKSGYASVFSWVEPIRPYFICLTILVLSLAWYQKMKPVKPVKGKMNQRPRFIQSVPFFVMLTVLAGLMLAFPVYAHIFYPSVKKPLIGINQHDIRKVKFKITGMTCTACEEHINYEVNALFGIINSSASYANGTTIVEYDQSKTTISKIEQTINATGYSVLFQKRE